MAIVLQRARVLHGISNRISTGAYAPDIDENVQP